MKWLRATLRQVAPPQRAEIVFDDDDVVWQLSLDQIESQTGRILKKVHARAVDAGTSTFAFDAKHVLYSKLRPYLNKVVRPDEPGLATTELVPMRPIPGLLNADFLKFYLRSDAFVNFANLTVAGAKMPRMIMDRFWEHQIPIPAPREQVRIVELLEQTDELRRQRAEADALAARILPALFRRMFGDPSQNERGWRTAQLGTFLDAIESGWSPNCENNPARADEWGVLKLGAVSKNRYLDAENKALPTTVLPEPQLEVKPGDLLFSRKNTMELVGACAFAFETRSKLMLSDLIFRLRIRADAELHPLYLWGLLTYPSKRSAIQALAGGSAGSMPNISKGRLETLTIEAPPFPLQTQFADSVQRIHDLRCEAVAGAKKLETLFQTILHRAFTGELTANWRKGHMKELLAEMEQQARLLVNTNGATL